MQSALLMSKTRGAGCGAAITELGVASSIQNSHTASRHKDSCSVKRPTEANDESCAAYLESGSAHCQRSWQM